MSFSLSFAVVTWFAIAFLALALSGLVARYTTLAATVANLNRSLASDAKFSEDQALMSIRDRIPDGREALKQETIAYIFSSVRCGSCQKLASEVAVHEQLADMSVFIFEGDAPLEPFYDDLTTVPHQDRAFSALGVPVLPYVVIQHHSGRVLRRLPVAGAEELLAAAEQVVSL
jgi:hypothetical protein